MATRFAYPKLEYSWIFEKIVIDMNNTEIFFNIESRLFQLEYTIELIEYQSK